MKFECQEHLHGYIVLYTDYGTVRYKTHHIDMAKYL